MFSMMNSIHGGAAIAVIGLAVLPAALPALAGEAMRTPEEVYKEVEATLGGVPSFVKALPKSVVGGFWSIERDLELSDTTALDPKTKALISLAVAAQIPCQYCIWSDTNAARQFGATDEEIGEAVSMGALTRFSSTVLNGLQVDFETFKQEMGGP